MKTLIKLSTIVLAAAVLTACGGGGGGSKTPVSEKTQVEKANLFARGLNTYTETERNWKLVEVYVSGYYTSSGSYVSGYYTTEYQWVTETVTKISTQYAIAKSDTLVKGASVLVDTFTNRYFAVDMTNFYKVAADTFSYENTGAKNYKESQTTLGLAYYNLRFNGDTTYSFILPDGKEGLRFNATEITLDEVDMNDIKAEIYATRVAVIAKNLASGLNFSAEKANEAAELIASAQDADGMMDPNLSEGQMNDIAKQVVGVDMKDISAALSGSPLAQAKVAAAAVANGLVADPQAAADAAMSAIRMFGKE